METNKTIDIVSANVQKLSHEELVDVATHALYHLYKTSGCRNCFIGGIEAIPDRSLYVKNTQDNAATFLEQHRKLFP